MNNPVPRCQFGCSADGPVCEYGRQIHQEAVRLYHALPGFWSPMTSQDIKKIEEFQHFAGLYATHIGRSIDG